MGKASSENDLFETFRSDLALSVISLVRTPKSSANGSRNPFRKMKNKQPHRKKTQNKMAKKTESIMKVHPMCRLFNSIAPLSNEEYQQLSEDIKERGIRVPILVNPTKDTILDGLNRHNVAFDLKLDRKDIPMEVFKGDEQAVSDEIISRNLRRRHMTDEQRAGVISKFRGPVLEKEAKDRMEHKNGDEGNKSASGAFSKGAVVKQLAKEAGVSQHKMQQIEKVRKTGDLDAVIAGKEKAKTASRRAPVKKKPRKEIPFEDQVYAKWSRFIQSFAPAQRRRVMEMVNVWCASKKS
jgi:hypothetical protein